MKDKLRNFKLPEDKDTRWVGMEGLLWWQILSPCFDKEDTNTRKDSVLQWSMNFLLCICPGVGDLWWGWGDRVEKYMIIYFRLYWFQTGCSVPLYSGLNILYLWVNEFLHGIEQHSGFLNLLRLKVPWEREGVRERERKRESGGLSNGCLECSVENFTLASIARNSMLRPLVLPRLCPYH